MLRRLNSWWHGLKIGQFRFIQGCPFLIGNFMHLAPVACWRDEEKSSLRFRVHRQEWDGFKWVLTHTVQVDHTKYHEIVESVKTQEEIDLGPYVCD